MSVEEIRATIAEIEQRAGSAAEQLGRTRAEIDEVAELLAHISQGSIAPEAGDALTRLRTVSDKLGHAVHDALVAGETAGEYAGRL